MATLATQTVVPGGLAPTYNACNAGGDKVAPGDHTYLHVKNASGGALTVTVDDPISQSPAGASAFNADIAVSVPAAGERLIGPLPATRFAAVSDGLVAITYSGVTSLTMAVLRTG